MTENRDDLDNSIDLTKKIHIEPKDIDKIRINEILENKFKELELKKKDIEVDEFNVANQLRKKFAIWSLCYVTFFTISVIATLWLSATNANKFFMINFDNPFILDNSVLIALLTTFTAQIIGVIAFVMVYLFKHNNKN